MLSSDSLVEFRSAVKLRLRLVFSLFGCYMFFVCMLLRSGLSFRICCSLLLMPGICVSVTSLVRCKICMVGFRIVYSSVLFRIFPFFVSALPLLFVSLLMKSMLPGLCSFYFSFPMCFALSVRLFSSVLVFSLSLFCPIVSCRLLRSCIWRLAVLRQI